MQAQHTSTIVLQTDTSTTILVLCKRKAYIVFRLFKSENESSVWEARARRSNFRHDHHPLVANDHAVVGKSHLFPWSELHACRWVAYTIVESREGGKMTHTKCKNTTAVFTVWVSRSQTLTQRETKVWGRGIQRGYLP